jgi:runt-related transcription factor 1
MARYCGQFCQHKDWENHHRTCGDATGGANGGQREEATANGEVKDHSEAAGSSPPSNNDEDCERPVAAAAANGDEEISVDN